MGAVGVGASWLRGRGMNPNAGFMKTVKTGASALAGDARQAVKYGSGVVSSAWKKAKKRMSGATYGQ